VLSALVGFALAMLALVIARTSSLPQPKAVDGRLTTSADAIAI
jgi:hypothetical protein